MDDTLISEVAYRLSIFRQYFRQWAGMVAAYTENIDTCIRLLLSYGLEAIDAALVVELQRQSLHGARGRPSTLCSTAAAGDLRASRQRLRRSESSGPASL